MIECCHSIYDLVLLMQNHRNPLHHSIKPVICSLAENKIHPSVSPGITIQMIKEKEISNLFYFKRIIGHLSIKHIGLFVFLYPVYHVIGERQSHNFIRGL